MDLHIAIGVDFNHMETMRTWFAQRTTLRCARVSNVGRVGLQAVPLMVTSKCPVVDSFPSQRLAVRRTMPQSNDVVVIRFLAVLGRSYRIAEGRCP